MKIILDNYYRKFIKPRESKVRYNSQREFNDRFDDDVLEAISYIPFASIDGNKNAIIIHINDESFLDPYQSVFISNDGSNEIYYYVRTEDNKWIPKDPQSKDKTFTMEEFIGFLNNKKSAGFNCIPVCSNAYVMDDDFGRVDSLLASVTNLTDTGLSKYRLTYAK